MPISTEQEFEDRLAQVCRLYRGLHALWKATDTTNPKEVVKWTVASSKLLEKLTEALGEAEEYCGAMELRLILDQLVAERVKRDEARRT